MCRWLCLGETHSSGEEAREEWPPGAPDQGSQSSFSAAVLQGEGSRKGECVFHRHPSVILHSSLPTPERSRYARHPGTQTGRANQAATQTTMQPGRRAGGQEGRRAGRLAGRPAGRRVGRQAGRLAGWQAGNLAGWQPGSQAAWQAASQPARPARQAAGQPDKD